MKLKKGDSVMVTRRGKTQRMTVVAKWASGEGDGYAMKLPGQQDHECVDVAAKHIVKK